MIRYCEAAHVSGLMLTMVVVRDQEKGKAGGWKYTVVAILSTDVAGSRCVHLATLLLLNQHLPVPAY